MEEVEGTDNLILHFHGLDKTKTSLALSVVINPHITQDVLLGNYFTGSDAETAETNNSLYPTKDYNTN
jgi:hypothetical protein